MWHVILSALLALLFLATGAGKVLGLGFANRNRDQLHVSPTFWRITGLLEWAGAAGLLIGIWWWPIGLAAACGLAVLMIGAIGVRVRSSRVERAAARRVWPAVAADVAVFVIAVVTALLIARGV